MHVRYNSMCISLPPSAKQQREMTNSELSEELDCKTVVFGRFQKARSAVSVILECGACEPHTPTGCLRRENDCGLFIERIHSKRGSNNVTEVTEIT